MRDYGLKIKDLGLGGCARDLIMRRELLVVLLCCLQPPLLPQKHPVDFFGVEAVRIRSGAGSGRGTHLGSLRLGLSYRLVLG